MYKKFKTVIGIPAYLMSMNDEDISKMVTHESGWTNYGDANPFLHGGMFLHWNESRKAWDVVYTVMRADVDGDYSEEDEQYVVKEEIDLDMLFVDGDVNNGPTDELQDALESLNMNWEAAVVDNTLERVASFYVGHVPIMSHGYNVETCVTESDYEEMLRGYGVDV